MCVKTLNDAHFKTEGVVVKHKCVVHISNQHIKCSCSNIKRDNQWLYQTSMEPLNPYLENNLVLEINLCIDGINSFTSN